LWLGRIANKKFCSLMMNEIEGRTLRNEKQLLKLMLLVQNEAEGQVTYYTVDKICDKLNLPVPPQKNVLNKLRADGFQAVLTHFNSRGFRTDAPAAKVTEIITSLVPQKR
jgi:tRNA (guanine26-N2/guanine27-N2)-dimethyltransferase